MKNNYTNLHCHSFFSILDGLSSPAQIVDRCCELEMSSCAITDHGNLFGSLQFIEACQEKNIKPIVGIELYLCKQDPQKKDQENRKLDHLVVLAKNLEGWKNLIKLITESNLPKNFYYKNRLDLNGLTKFCNNNFICLTGHLGSTLSSQIFPNGPDCSNLDEAKKHANKNWVNDSVNHIGQLKDIFGKENVFLEIQLIDKENNPKSVLLSQAMRHLEWKTGTQCIANNDAHYCRQEDAIDQRVLLASSMQKTFQDIYNKNSIGEVGLSSFFNSRNYYIHSYEEMLNKGHTEEELKRTLDISDMCEEYDLKNPPLLPNFPLPQNTTSEEHLLELCRKGWKERYPKIKKIIDSGKFTEQDYVDRLKIEMETLSETKLHNYFLLVEDVIRYAKDQGYLRGIARGSSAGSLLLYLLEVTHVDPLEYDLLFERFYNRGRNTKDRISLPDIDIDTPRYGRENIIQYIRDKYGKDNVAQIITFSRMQGRAVIKDVFRVNNALSFSEINDMTSGIPDEGAISDQLGEIKEKYGKKSIVMWALENNKKELSKWAHLDDNNEIQGDYANLFKQAFRLEGTVRGTSKHAAGLCISPIPLSDVTPLVYDKTSKELIAGFELDDLESKLGLMKLDVLAISMLDKVQGVLDLLKTGKLNA